MNIIAAAILWGLVGITFLTRVLTGDYAAVAVMLFVGVPLGLLVAWLYGRRALEP